MKKWHSIHVFIRTNKLQDDLIIYLQKLFRDRIKIEKWFFIRYWLGGPHLRIRYLGYVSSNNLVNIIEKFIEEHQEPKVHLHKMDYYDNINIIAEGIETKKDKLPWYSQGAVLPIKYEPEYSRYGGHSVMDLTEKLFYLSTELSTILVDCSGENYSLRFSLGMAFLDKILQHLPEEFFIDGKVSFLEFCSKEWKSYGISNINLDKKLFFEEYKRNRKKYNEVLDIIESKFSFFEQIIEILNKIEKTKDQYPYMDSILFSHLHMTFNRLGIYPEIEEKIYVLIEGVIISENI